MVKGGDGEGGNSLGGRGYASGDVWPVGESSGYGNKYDKHSNDGGNSGVGGDNAWNDSEGSGGDRDGNQRGDGGK